MDGQGRMSASAPAIGIRRGYRPGAIGRVVELHGCYYSKYWDFGVFFETKVARELSAFMDRYDDERDGFWTAILDGKVEGRSPLTVRTLQGKALIFAGLSSRRCFKGRVLVAD